MTLAVLIVQTNLIREQQRMSVLPYLSLGNEGFGSSNFKYQLRNNGIGPAFIESVTIFYQDSTYNMDLPIFLYNHVEGFDTLQSISHTNLRPGHLIPAGSILALLQVNGNLAEAQSLVTILSEESLEMEIVYENIYGDRWLLDTKSISPVPIK